MRSVLEKIHVRIQHTDEIVLGKCQIRQLLTAILECSRCVTGKPLFSAAFLQTHLPKSSSAVLYVAFVNASADSFRA